MARGGGATAFLFVRKKSMDATDGASDRHHRDRGATAVEYALLIALIAAVIFGAVVALGGEVTGLFERVNWWD